MQRRKSVSIKPNKETIAKTSGFRNFSWKTNKLTAIIFVVLFAGLGSYLVSQGYTANVVVKGVVPDLTWGTSRTDMDKTVLQMQDAGVKWARMNISWNSIERDGKGIYNTAYLTDIDYAVDKARAAGIEVLMPISDGVPYWASADPNKKTDSTGQYWNKFWRPTSMSDYADFTSWVVNRYKGKGVHTYEVWNEPNHPYFWPSGINASEYVDMLKTTYPLIKRADPSALVLMGGLSKGDYNFLQQIYSAGGAPYFDVANVHPYTGSVDPTICWNQSGTTKKALDAFCSIEEVRNTMVANGDSTAQLWLTEFGWSTCSCSYGVTEANQANYITKAFSMLDSYGYVQKAFIYNLRNTYWQNNDPTDWNANTGLLRTDFSQKPAYAAFKAYGASTADTTSPTQPTNLSSPSQTSTSINLSWTASTDNIGVTGYDIYRDNLKVSTVAANSFSDANLTASKSYAYYVVARDAAGNSSPASTTINATTQAPALVTTDTAAPTVSISTPANGSTIGRSVAINANSSDNVKVTKLEVWIDGRQKTSNTNTTFISYTWNSRKTSSGAHTITIKAYDGAGNVGQSSVVVYR